MKNRTVVVNYGIGNVYSVCNALNKLGSDALLTSVPSEIRDADRGILPGVGAFGRAMDALETSGLSDPLRDFVATGRPFLGVCIGMQMLMDSSTEFGNYPGLGLIPGEVRRLDDVNMSGVRRRVPHIGWSGLDVGNASSNWAATPLAELVPESDAVYFVHSYHCVPRDKDSRIAIADYEGLEVTAAIQRDNIFGVQFHPERSGEVGHTVLRSFLNL